MPLLHSSWFVSLVTVKLVRKRLQASPERQLMECLQLINAPNRDKLSFTTLANYDLFTQFK